ncbi:MAG: class I SAM-dependent methyltransferase [Betaproteobacteria bacterium]|nr:class I SAM-dependent methyltransferase [Betaproteobacteria bacterium]
MEELIAQARSLEARDPARAADLYWQVLGEQHANLEAHNALERLNARQRYSAWMRINCVIDPRDDIFRFIAGQDISRNAIREYLSDGWRTLSELMVLMDSVDRPLTRVASMLEFASGYGRFTRHLVKVLPGRITCADILPGANEFVHEQFGVRVLDSARQPESFHAPHAFELVFVLSLFTHVPPARWAAWLQALYRATQPGGLLVFTIHNERMAIDEGVRFHAAGTHFIPTSESPSLGGDVYGTTFTTRAWAERCVEEALGIAPLAFREHAFWVGQDALVVARA